MCLDKQGTYHLRRFDKKIFLTYVLEIEKQMAADYYNFLLVVWIGSRFFSLH